jgi:DNA-binding CsgD family transcriptional regulator
VSRETVRTQLKSLLVKTGTGRQAQLALLLSGLRPV